MKVKHMKRYMIDNNLVIRRHDGSHILFFDFLPPLEPLPLHIMFPLFCLAVFLIAVILIPALILVPLHKKSREAFLRETLIADFLAYRSEKIEPGPRPVLERFGQSPGNGGLIIGEGMYD